MLAFQVLQQHDTVATFETTRLVGAHAQDQARATVFQHRLAMAEGDPATAHHGGLPQHRLAAGRFQLAEQRAQRAIDLAVDEEISLGDFVDMASLANAVRYARDLVNEPANFLTPEALLIPVNVFDTRGYRIGYGGGYFDRTLASPQPAPLTIGVGFELARVDSIEPEEHDVPLAAIVTEAGVLRI